MTPKPLFAPHQCPGDGVKSSATTKPGRCSAKNMRIEECQATLLAPTSHTAPLLHSYFTASTCVLPLQAGRLTVCPLLMSQKVGISEHLQPLDDKRSTEINDQELIGHTSNIDSWLSQHGKKAV